MKYSFVMLTLKHYSFIKFLAINLIKDEKLFSRESYLTDTFKY